MEYNVIYNEDCLKTMASLPDNSVDLIVTSPPYNFGGFSRNGRKSKYETYSDDMPEEDYKVWITEVLKDCARILKQGGVMYWNHKGRFENREYKHVFWIIDKCPLNFIQHIVWKYPSSPDVAKIKWYPRHEEVFMFSKGTPNYFNEDMAAFGDVWEISHIQKNSHPAPFPLAIAKRAIEGSCPENGVVYDPFMGSGTTALATLDIGGGRTYIGSEISEKYCKMAEERIKIQTSQLTLF